jgi:hypothetical protein
MCGPAIPLILSVAATAVSAASQYQQAQSEAKQYERQAIVARQQAVFESQRQQRDIRRRLGALHASAAGSGVLTGSGSPLDLAANFVSESELEPFETIRQGLIEFQDLKFGARRTKSAAGANLLSSALDTGAQVTGRLPFFQ